MDLLIFGLQGDTLAPFLFIIYQDYQLRMSIDLMTENGFELKKNRQYPTETITDADEADDLVLFPNTPAQVESLLHRLEQAARDISLYESKDKTEFICFNQVCGIASFNGKPLKLVDQLAIISHLVKEMPTYAYIKLELSLAGYRKRKNRW